MSSLNWIDEWARTECFPVQVPITHMVGKPIPVTDWLGLMNGWVDPEGGLIMPRESPAQGSNSNSSGDRRGKKGTSPRIFKEVHHDQAHSPQPTEAGQTNFSFTSSAPSMSTVNGIGISWFQIFTSLGDELGLSSLARVICYIWPSKGSRNHFRPIGNHGNSNTINFTISNIIMHNQTGFDSFLFLFSHLKFPPSS